MSDALSRARDFVERHEEMLAMQRKHDATGKELSRITDACADAENHFARNHPGEAFILGNLFLRTGNDGQVTMWSGEVLS